MVPYVEVCQTFLCMLLVQFLKSTNKEKGDHIYLLQKHIAIIQDILSQFSKVEQRHKKGTICEIVNAITKRADGIQHHISKVRSRTTAGSSVEVIQHFLYDSKNFDNQITSLFEHCNCSQFYSAASMTAALTALSECCPDILRSNVSAPLRAYRYHNLTVVGHCVTSARLEHL